MTPEAIIPDLETHDIYASNLLIGEALICGLRLPLPWQLAPGVSRPEIVATHRRRDQKWVVTGDAWYEIHDGERRWAMELAIHVRPLSRRNESRTGQGTFVAGHPARTTWKNGRRGLPWRRHDVTFMTVTFDCPYSERRFKLEFSGWCPREGFEEILAALRHFRCH